MAQAIDLKATRHRLRRFESISQHNSNLCLNSPNFNDHRLRPSSFTRIDFLVLCLPEETFVFFSVLLN